MRNFEQLVKDVGFLSDTQIKRCIENGFLLEAGSWNESQIRHASYTVRLGDKVEISRLSDWNGEGARPFTVHRLSAGNSVQLQPGDIAMLYSQENLRFPNSILGFTVARGLLFAEGLCPENTYIDPGFTGSIYTTVTNVSNRILLLPHGLPLARLFFYHLAVPVSTPYRSGSSLGINQQLQSVGSVPIISLDGCKKSTNKELLQSISHVPLYGSQICESLTRLFKMQSKLKWEIYALAFMVLIMIIGKIPWFANHLSELSLGVTSSLIASLIWWLGPKFKNLGSDL